MFFVFRDPYVLCIYVMYILCTFHIFMYGYVTVLHDGFWFVHIPLGSMVKFQFLAQFPVNRHNHPVVPQLKLILCQFVTFFYKVIIISSLSPYNVHLLFCWILSIFTLILYAFMALFCVAIRRDTVSLFRFPFRSHVKGF